MAKTYVTQIIDAPASQSHTFPSDCLARRVIDEFAFKLANKIFVNRAKVRFIGNIVNQFTTIHIDFGALPSP